MTVHQLIMELLKCDPQATVYIPDADYHRYWNTVREWAENRDRQDF
jgi:hypothetical protein